MPRRRTRGSGALERLPSGRYRVRWRTLDHRYASKSFTVKADAERFLRQTLVDQEREGIGIQARSVTLGGIAANWWTVKRPSWKTRTAERYEDHLEIINRELGATPINDITFDTVQRFVSELPLAPKTVQGCYGVLALILKHAARTGKLTRAIPKPDLPRVSKPKLTIPTRSQVDALAAASDARIYALVILAGYCGLREGELLALHQADVNLEERWVFVHQARNRSNGEVESTKTEAVRRVALPTIVCAALTIHLDEYPGKFVAPATTTSGRWPEHSAMTASLMRNSWVRARSTCGIDKVRFHDLRHAAASMMIAAGLNVLQVSKQLGHANPTETLNTYGHLWPESFDDAMRRLDEYLAG